MLIRTPLCLMAKPRLVTFLILPSSLLYSPIFKANFFLAFFWFSLSFKDSFFLTFCQYECCILLYFASLIIYFQISLFSLYFLIPRYFFLSLFFQSHLRLQCTARDKALMLLLAKTQLFCTVVLTTVLLISHDHSCADQFSDQPTHWLQSAHQGEILPHWAALKI